jgi:cupin fold WbuC family metalloprotein
MKLISRDILSQLAEKAAAAPRARAHHNLHETPADLVQRFFVTATSESYFRPHRHASKSEMAILMQGAVDVLTFDEQGRVIARFSIGEGAGDMGYETPKNTWHTLFATTPHATFLEIKQGPYDPATASEFAPWSPAEGEAAATEFSRWLRDARPGDPAPR